jgi:endonuclease/exonuclease/phosphatase family metal-dependent hydrolase
VASFRIVTYNIHKCRGLDQRVRPGRIAEVLAETGADIIALQEVWSVESGSEEANQARYIARELGMEMCAGINRRLGGAYGNVVLSRLPIGTHANYDITWRGREPRGCLRVDIGMNEMRAPLHVFNVHLGTAFLERRHQARRLLDKDILGDEELTGVRIVLGDFNEWTRGLASRLLAAHFTVADPRTNMRRSRTYPGIIPLLHLDHIYYDSSLELVHLNLHRSRRALVASDHLPLVADFKLRPS